MAAEDAAQLFFDRTAKMCAGNNHLRMSQDIWGKDVNVINTRGRRLRLSELPRNLGYLMAVRSWGGVVNKSPTYVTARTGIDPGTGIRQTVVKVDRRDVINSPYNSNISLTFSSDGDRFDLRQRLYHGYFGCWTGRTFQDDRVLYDLTTMDRRSPGVLAAFESLDLLSHLSRVEKWENAMANVANFVRQLRHPWNLRQNTRP